MSNQTSRKSRDVFIYTTMRPIRISIPASSGSFHHHAANRYFGESSVLMHHCDMLSALQCVNSNAADYAVLACENTSAGIFYETYRLISESGLFIIDEVYEPVSLCLAACEGVHIENITHVISHPYAILQAKGNLARVGLNSCIESTDTIVAAIHVSENPDQSLACICDERAANAYRLQVLLQNVQKEMHNHTRFFIIGKGNVLHEEFDKIIGVAAVPLISRHANIRMICDQNHAKFFFEAEIDHSWNSTLLSEMKQSGCRIIGYSKSRNIKESIHNPIHISL